MLKCCCNRMLLKYYSFIELTSFYLRKVKKKENETEQLRLKITGKDPVQPKKGMNIRKLRKCVSFVFLFV